MNMGPTLTAIGNADRDQLKRFGTLMYLALKNMPKLTHAQRKERVGYVTRGTHRRNAMQLRAAVQTGLEWHQIYRGPRELDIYKHRVRARHFAMHALNSGVPEERVAGIAMICFT